MKNIKAQSQRKDEPKSGVTDQMQSPGYGNLGNMRTEGYDTKKQIPRQDIIQQIQFDKIEKTGTRDMLR